MLSIGRCSAPAASLILVVLGGACSNDPPTSAEQEDATSEFVPALGLMSSLPLIWPETHDVGELLSDEAPAAHPAYRRLEREYQVVPIDNIGAGGALKEIDLLLMAQPRPLSPREFVVLDEWVRGGGKVFLLIDPMLAWPSIYPLGDNRRPMPTALMSPILARWGLEFRYDDKGPGTQEIEADGLALESVSLGHFAILPGDDTAFEQCRLKLDAHLAECQIGAGQVRVFGDADLLQPDLMIGTHNLAWVLFSLDELRED